MAVSVGTLGVKVIAETRALTAGLARASTHIKSFSARTEGYMRANSASIRIAVKMAAVVAAAVIGVAKKYADFQQAMVTATAVSEVSGAEFAHMSQMAEDMAKKWGIASSELASGFYFLGSAGLSVQEQIAAFPAVTTLAKAALMDMGAATEIVVDTMKGFKIPFTDTIRVTDILTKGVTSANMTFGQLGDSMSYVSGVARTANMSLEETVAVLGLMANVGIKGSMAGTSLRRALINLMAPASEARKTLESLGVSVYDNTGRMITFSDILADLVPALNRTTEATRNMALKQLFGARAITGMTEMVYQGAAGVRDFTAELKEAAGTAERVASKQVNTLKGDFIKLTAEVMELVHSIGEDMEPALRQVISVIKEFTQAIKETEAAATT